MGEPVLKRIFSPRPTEEKIPKLPDSALEQLGDEDIQRIPAEPVSGFTTPETEVERIADEALAAMKENAKKSKRIEDRYQMRLKLGEEKYRALQYAELRIDEINEKLTKNPNHPEAQELIKERKWLYQELSKLLKEGKPIFETK